MARLMVLVAPFPWHDAKIIVPRRRSDVCRVSSPGGIGEGRQIAGGWRLTRFSADVLGYSWAEQHGHW